MSRTKKAARKGPKPAKKDVASSSTPAPDAPGLIEKAHVLLAQSNFELAIKFLERALSLEPSNLEARELVGIAELEGGDGEKGRDHLLRLFPPHTPEPPSQPSPYLYLAQSAQDPHEALGYYSTAASMLEKTLKGDVKGKGRDLGVDLTEEREMAVRALVAMIEIWMSDLCMEESAEANCDTLILRALSIAPEDVEVRIALASIRMSEQRFDEAKEAILKLYEEIDDKEPFDETLPSLPARLTLSRLLLEHNLHIPSLSILQTAREEDDQQVESAYLEGWTYYLLAEHLQTNPSPTSHPKPKQTMIGVDSTVSTGEEEEDEEEPLTVQEAYSESLRALLECKKLFVEQEYPDEGIGKHLEELLEVLQGLGVVVPVGEEEGEEGGGEEGWDEVEEVDMGDEDVEMDDA